MNAQFLITMSMTLSLLMSVYQTIPMTRCMAALAKRSLTNFHAANGAARFSAQAKENNSEPTEADRYADTLKITNPQNSMFDETITVWDAVHEGDARAARWFFDAGVDPNVKRIPRSYSPGYDEKFHKCNVSRTLLGQALRMGWSWDEGYKGEYVNPGNYRGRDHRSIIRMLLMRGANPNTPDSGLKADGIMRSITLIANEVPLALTNCCEITVRLLEAEADPGEVKSCDFDLHKATGGTLLHWSTYPKEMSIADLEYQHSFDGAWERLERGVSDRSIAFCNPYGTNLLAWAVRKQNRNAVNLLLSIKPDLVHGKDAFGLMPLHWAIYGGDIEIIQALFKAGAHVDGDEVKDSLGKTGKTPFDIAMRCGKPEAMKILKHYQTLSNRKGAL